MALNAYLKLEGVNQGNITGSVTQKGREGQIMVIAFNHEVECSSTTTGKMAGQRKHAPLTILKEIDQSSPLLMKMLISKEIIKLWELRFWQPTKTGQEFQFYTIQLQDAKIVQIKQEMLNNKYPENTQHREREFVTFQL